MADLSSASIRGAEVVLGCEELDRSLPFYTETLGFEVSAIFPADDPQVAVLRGHGLSLRLQRDPELSAGRLRLLLPAAALEALDATVIEAPNGTRIELVAEDPPVAIPPLVETLVVSTPAADASGSWVLGRAGMRYRDLLPGRLGGRFIASHIHIPDGGPVPDYVHFHRVRFQMIYCLRGWVRVVYEDQGPPFVMQAGDCVLQPPQIRHRVLESSADLEVLEIGCPAEHETRTDPALTLPNAGLAPDRRFGGQRFQRHVAADARWQPWRAPGFEARDVGIAAATGGLAGVRAVRASASGSGAATGTPHGAHGGELLFYFVLKGTTALRVDGHPDAPLGVASAVSVPSGLGHALSDCSADLEFLEVTLPAELPSAS